MKLQELINALQDAKNYGDEQNMDFFDSVSIGERHDRGTTFTSPKVILLEYTRDTFEIAIVSDQSEIESKI